MDKTPVSTVMTTSPHMVDEKATLYDAAILMQQHECGALPVVANSTKPVGILTDRDIVIYGIAAGYNMQTTLVKEIMSADVVTCNEYDTLSLAADVMSEHDVHRLVVVNKSGDIVGILSASDMIKCADSDTVNDDVLHHLYRYA
jgi:CBS domain-containing protein